MKLFQASRVALFLILSTSLLGVECPEGFFDFVQSKERIAFVRTLGIVNGRGNSHILVVDGNGDQEKQLTSGVASYGSPGWSGTGTEIVFTRREPEADGFDFNLWIMKEDGSDERPIDEFPSAELGPDWSPVAPLIAFATDRTGNFEIFLISPGGGGLQNLTQHPAGDFAPAWSPDGSKIVFVSERSGHPNLFIMNSDGSEQRQITADSCLMDDPAWSPNGIWIAFKRQCDGETSHIFRVRPDGSQLEQLTFGSFSDVAPEWSPDGTRIVFASNRSPRGIYIMQADGTMIRSVTNGDAAPDWRPSPVFSD